MYSLFPARPHMRQIICYDHNTMSRMNLWKSPTSGRKAQKTANSVTPKNPAFIAPTVALKAPTLPPIASTIPVPDVTPPTTEEVHVPEEEPVREVQREEELQPRPTVRKYGVLTRRQRRRQSVSISVSEEEEDILRAAAHKKGKSFSSWAREALFKAAGKKMPKRPS